MQDKFNSKAFARLFAMLKAELSDDYFAEIEQHLTPAQISSRHPDQRAIRQRQQGQETTSCASPTRTTRSWLTRLLAEKPPSYTFQLHPRDEAGARALSELNDRGVNLVANALAQSTDHILSFFQMLRTELAFYIGCLNLHAQLGQMGEPMCFPIPAPAGERKLSFSGLHDVALALSMERKVVGNDLNADRRDIVIITGANTGGKSTFLRSVGLAHLMMQAGMFVPAKSFASEVCDGIFTHYKREEDAKHGKRKMG